MANVDTLEPIALKEWAVTVKALAEGRQLIVMRKGGIAEETREFQLVSPRFYLMPAYEHQKHHLLKEIHRSELDELLADWRNNDGMLRLNAYAEVVQDIEVTDQETLDKLRDFHIWTDGFAEERLKWKRTKPLHVLVLRVYKLDEEVELPIVPAYTGCKSWARLEQEVQHSPYKPVLSDEDFYAQVDRINQALL